MISRSPRQYGIDINVGDTRGVSGIFRALRTIPVMLDIARDMERLCPDATLLNYTNPMAMLCRAMQRESNIQLTGLCHSVQGTAGMLASWIGAPVTRSPTPAPASTTWPGTWTSVERRKDAYPLIRKAVTERGCLQRRASSAMNCSCTLTITSPNRAGTTRSTTGGSANAPT
jgi:alpha-galactosidase